MNNKQPSNYQAIFRQRSFRLFWLGFTFSVLGDTMTRVALTWFVYELTHAPRALGWLNFFYTGPVIVGGLVAGWLLDRFERRKVLLIDNVVRGLAVATIPLLHALGQLQLWQIYAVAAVYGSLMMISLAGGPAIVPDLVEKRHLATANALEILSFTLGGVIAPPLAGWLIGRIGAPYVLIVDVVSYALFALALSQIRTHQESAMQAAAKSASYRLVDAVRLLRHNTVLLSTTLMFMAFNVGLGMVFVWLPVYADLALRGGATLYGTLLGFLALGEVASSLLVGAVAFKRPLGWLIAVAQLLSGVALAFFFVGQMIWTTAVGLLLLGFFSAPLTIWAQTLRMNIIPEGLRGRTFALLRMLMQGTNPIGGVTAGFLQPLLGFPVLIGLSLLFIGLPGFIGAAIRPLREATETNQPLSPGNLKVL